MKTNSHLHRLPACGLVVAAVLFSLAAVAQAANDTWSGNGTTPNWSDTGNWNAVPVGGDNLIFSGTTQTINVNDLTGLSLGWLWLNNYGYNITGNPITLTGGITNSYDGSSLGVNVTFNGAQVIEVDAGTLTFSGALTNNGGLTINGPGTMAWTDATPAAVPTQLMTGSGNLIINGPSTVNVSGGFVYPSAGPNFPGNTIVNSGGTLNMGASCFDGNSPVGQSLTINPGGTVNTTQPHIAGSAGRPLSIYGGILNMGSEAYFTTVILSNATLTTSTIKDLRGNGSFTNLASAATTVFGVALNLTSSRVIGVDDGAADPDIDFQGNGTTAIQGTGNLTKVGTGKMQISGSATHSGTTLISAGTLVLAGSMANTPTITLASNTVFDISGASFSLSANQTLAGSGTVIGTLLDYNVASGEVVSPGGNGVAGTLSFSGLNLNGNTALNFDLANTTVIGGGTNDLIVATNLTLSSGNTNTVNLSSLSGTLLQGVPYTLIKYTTCGAPAGQVTTLATPPSHFIYNFTNDTANSRITVTVTGNPFNLVWKGDGSINAWDITTSTNWLNGGSPIVYFDGDNTTFSDVGSNTPAVNLTAIVKPTVLTVNATKDYTFGGSGKISGGAQLIKSNSGSLTLLANNDFSGGSSLNGSGTVTVGNGSATVANLGGAGNLTNNTKVIFFENASVNYAGNMSGTGSVTAFMPAATLTLTGSNTFTGGLTLRNGTLQIGNDSVASVAGNITNYGALNLYRSDAYTNKNFITSDGNTLEYGNGDVNIRGAGGMTVDGTASISSGYNGNFAVSQQAAGKMTVNSGGLVNVGAVLVIGNQSNIKGDVVQNGGTINVVNHVRIGHWGNNASTQCTYAMNGGLLNVPNGQVAVGWDGIGIMTMIGGTVNTVRLTVDDNGNTPAVNGTNSTFYMTGGLLNVGTGGITSVTTTNQFVPTVQLSGGTIAAVAPAGFSSSMHMWLTNGTPTFSSTNNTITLTGVLKGNGGLIKTGSGILQLDATNIYSGTTTVAEGILQGAGVISGPVIVQTNAVLSAGGTLARGTLTVSNNVTVNQGASLVLDQASTALSTDFIKVYGNLTLDAATPLYLNFTGGTPYTGGANMIVTNTGTRTGSLVYVNPTRYSVTLDQSNPNYITTSFTGTNANLVWKGNVSANWDVTNTLNWLNAGVADKYYQSDVVLFDGTGIAQPNVNLASAITPASVSVNASGYKLSGSSIMSLGALTKNGAGTLTLDNYNWFSGGAFVNGGTLQIGNGASTGYFSNNIVNNASVAFNHSTESTYYNIISGSGSVSVAGAGKLIIAAAQSYLGGSLVNPGSTVQIGNGPLADAGVFGLGTVTNNGAVIFYRTPSIGVATPYTGAGSFTFLGTGINGQSSYGLNATNTFTGPVTLSLSRISSGFGAYSFGSPSSITVNPLSQVYAVAQPYSSVFNIPLTLAGTGWQDGLGALRMEGSAAGSLGVTWSGPITLANNAKIGVNNATTNTITGTITGAYELETYGGNAAAALVLSPTAANTYNALRVSIGTAGTKTIAGNNNAIPNNIPLTMNGGTLWLNGFSKSFSPFLNLSGSSSIQNGSSSSSASVTLAPPYNASLNYNGTFADGSSQPLNVTFNQSGPAATIALPTGSPNWTGNLTNNGGTISSGTQNTPFGSQAVLGRSIVGNNGATFLTTLNNVLNGYNGNVVLNNSTWLNNRYISMNPNAGYLYLANSTMTGTNSSDGNYETWQLPSTVIIRGTAPSYMLGAGTSPAYDLQSGGTTFDVADVTSGSDLIVGGGSSTTFLHSPANSTTGGTLIKTGLGTMELDGANTYTGSTIVQAGTLTVGAAAAMASTAYSISNGATLDVSALPSGLTLPANAIVSGSGTINGSLADASGTVISPGSSAGTLTITGNLALNGTGSLTIDLSNNTASGNDKIVVGGTLTLAAGTTNLVNFNFLNGAVAAGSYTLIQAGSISGTVATAFANASRYGATFSQVGNTVAVTFSGSSSNLVWTGTDPLVAATWDVAVSTNWSGPNVFYQSDSVLFDDSSVNTTVSMVVPVRPSSITFSNASNYTLDNGAYGNPGKITGFSTLTKKGTGTASIHCENLAVGPINVNEGILAYNGDNADNAYAGATTITVSNNAAFDFGSAADFVKTQPHTFVIQGAGPDGLGAVRSQVAGLTYGIASDSYISNFVLAADATIGGDQRWDIGPMAGSKLDGQGHNLTIVGTGSGAIDIRAQIITNVASITVSNPLTFYENYSQTNAWTATTTNYVMPGSSLGIYGGLAVSMPIVLTNATMLNQGGGTPNWLSPITLQGTNVFKNSGAQNFAGVLSGPGAIAIGGGSTTAGAIPGILTFSNASTFAGGVTISNAPVTITNSAAAAGYAAIVVTSSNGLGTGPITFDLSLMTTNGMTNTVRAVEFNVTGGGVIPNAIVLPVSAATGVTNFSLQGRDNSSIFTLSGPISGGYAGMTNWLDSATAGSVGVLRLSNPANTFVGTVYANRGNLAITADGCLGNSANLLRLNQNTLTNGLRFDAPGINVAHKIESIATSYINLFGDNNGDGIQETVNNATISGAISGASRIRPIGGGTLTLSGVNTHAGTETWTPGAATVQFADAASLGSGFFSPNWGGTFRYTGTGSQSTACTLWVDNAGPPAGGTIDIQSATAVLTVTGTGSTINQPLNKTGLGAFILSGQAISGGALNVNGGTMTVGGAISGNTPVTVNNGSTLILNGANTYVFPTLVNSGSLYVNGSTPAGSPLTVNGTGTSVLGGVGTINGPVVVNAGAALQPGTNSIGKLTVNNALSLAGTTVMEVKNTGGLTNDMVAGLVSVSYGGSLVVTNLGNQADLTNGVKFTLFSSIIRSGSFSSITLPALNAGYAWTTNLAIDGSIQVVATVNTTPTNLTATVSGNVLSLSWPVDHTGWRLLVQTNNLAAGVSSNTNDWMTVAGSTAINQTNLVIDPVKPTEFYRLVYP